MKAIPNNLLISVCFAMHVSAQVSAQIEETNTGSILEEALLLKEHRHYAMIHAGDLDRGREFFLSESLACATCHTIDGSNASAGPDLSNIGDKLGRGDIIDSILQPSAIIADGYNLTEVETRDGEEYSGILKKSTAEWIELKGAGEVSARIATGDILNRHTSELSLMPEGLHLALTQQDLADLVEYIGSFKRPESESMFHQGTPNVIPQISKPIALIPFHSERHQFDRPVWFGQIPGEPNNFLILEHAVSRIWFLEKRAQGDKKTLFLDLGPQLSKNGARGLMGLEFHPNFRENRRYFLALHIYEKGQHIAFTVERKASADFKKDSGEPPRTVLRWNATTASHTGGGLEFGPDGFLYVGMGDTGPHEDPNGHAQNMIPSTLHT